MKWRCVATPRLSVAFSELAASGDVVGVGGLLEAIERRRLVRGSRGGFAILKSRTLTFTRQLKAQLGGSFEDAEKEVQ